MERIKLSDFVNLILFLEDQNRIRKSKTNNDLFHYVTELVDLLHNVSMLEELKFLKAPLVEYLEHYSINNQSYYSKQVNYEDRKMVNNTVFEFLLFFDKEIQNKCLYFPKNEKEFDQKLEELLNNGVAAFDNLNINFLPNLSYSKDTFTLGLYNSASLHLGIAVNIYFNYLFSILVKRQEDSYPNWHENLKELEEIEDEIYIPEGLIDLLHNVRMERNPTHHGEKNYTLDNVLEFIDRCFESISKMHEMLIKNGVPNIISEYLDV